MRPEGGGRGSPSLSAQGLPGCLAVLAADLPFQQRFCPLHLTLEKGSGLETKTEPTQGDAAEQCVWIGSVTGASDTMTESVLRLGQGTKDFRNVGHNSLSWQKHGTTGNHVT